MLDDMSTDEIEIDLKYYFYLLRSRWLFIVLLMLEAAIAAFVISRFQSPVYQSDTTLLISSSETSSDELAAVKANGIALTFSELLKSRDVLDAVREELGLQVTTKQLAANISTNIVANTLLVRLEVENNDPVMAATIANTLAQRAITFNQELQLSGYAQSQENLQDQLTYLETQIETTQRQLNSADASNIDQRTQLEAQLAQYTQDYTSLLQSYEDVRLQALQTVPNISQLEKAIINVDPIRPRVTLNTALGAILGLMAGVGYVLLRELLNDTVRDPDVLARRTDIPIIGHILHFDTSVQELITLDSPRSPSAETFRSLRLYLRYANVDQTLRSVVVTSASPSEGKSVLAANLAVVMAQSGHNTLLIDGDLRKPRQHRIFDISNRNGFSELFLHDEKMLMENISETVVDNLHVLTSGALPPNPADILESQKANKLIEEAEKQFDTVIIDAPPTLMLTDAAALSRHTDGVIVVVHVGQTKLKMVQRTIDRLQQVDANILGIILTGIRQDEMYGGYYYNYYGGYEYFEDDTNGRQKIRHGKRKSTTKPSSDVNLRHRITNSWLRK